MKRYKATFSKVTKYNAYNDFVNNVKSIFEAYQELSKYYTADEMDTLISIELIDENGIAYSLK